MPWWDEMAAEVKKERLRFLSGRVSTTYVALIQSPIKLAEWKGEI